MTLLADPSPQRGRRTRAGNAMGRARSGVISGALDSIERNGVRGTTMVEIAVVGGIAKATLYNHFRTKDEVLAAVVSHEVRRIASQASESGPGLADVLDVAASLIAEHPALRHVVSKEPAAAAALARIDDGPAWGQARALIAVILVETGSRAGAAEVEVVLRWLTSYVFGPAPAGRRANEARVVAESVRP